MNKDLLQKLRGGANGAGIQQAQQAVGAAGAGAPKPHHHFRLRPATEAPSQRQAGSTATPAGRQQQSLSGATGAGASPVAMRTVAGSQRPRGGGGDREGGSSAAAAPAAGLGIRPGRPAPSSIDSMFLPRKPGLGRPSGSSLGVSRAAREGHSACTAGLQAAACLTTSMAMSLPRRHKSPSTSRSLLICRAVGAALLPSPGGRPRWTSNL